jgi:hypothetical protein
VSANPPPRIALCMIVRDDADTIELALRSARPHVAEINVYDTGSTDGTLEIVRGLQAEPGPLVRLEEGEWRNDFAWARTRSWEMASPECDWLMWLDGDDELAVGTPIGDLLADLSSDVDGLACFYQWPNGGVWPCRLARRTADYRWVDPIDEWLSPPPGQPYRVEIADPAEIRVIHHKTEQARQESAARNLAMAAAWLGQLESCGSEIPARLHFTAGKNAMAMGDLERACAELFAFRDSCQPAYRVGGVRFLSAALQLANRNLEALRLLEEEYAREPSRIYAVDLAQLHLALGNTAAASQWATTALQLPFPLPDLFEMTPDEEALVAIPRAVLAAIRAATPLQTLVA